MIQLPHDIYELTPFVDVLRIILVTLMWIIVLSAVVYLAIKLVLKFKVRRKKEKIKTVFQLLSEIKKEVLSLDRSDQLKFFENLSWNFRLALETYYGIAFTNMTSLELYEAFARIDLKEEFLSDSRKFLKVSDLVKFSSYVASDQQMDQGFDMVIGCLDHVLDLAHQKELSEASSGK